MMAENWKNFFNPEEVTVLSEEDIHLIRKCLPELRQAKVGRIVMAWLAFTASFQPKDAWMMPVTDTSVMEFRYWLGLPN